ncbi:TonB-dependent receptor plug domain-containing protein [Sphingomonas abietis]|uniref:TonB-dependent receptor n=1 Tax=Sphingomonas abietis TaxID=3012344 RepID=A0ABY7NIC5_9SPHN|nr:TonB-dependent receptor [Sphingomonas abietis]WBO20750.1 TonB-dependent receptor [Sphingomonas abietis]
MNHARKTLARGALFATVATTSLILANQARAAQADAPVAAASAAPAVDDTIIVTGTRRTDRTVTDSPSPIDVITAADLRTQPTANIIDSLKNIIPSFFVGQNTISDASSFVRSPSLRGLPGDEVLVQLNGKRYNRSSLVQVYTGGDTGLSFGAQAPDISAIPSIAISNVQVLRDGATAQYGSDAIGGVMNFGLRKDAGFEVQGRWGQYYAGDGDSRQIAADGGVKLGERGFINVAGEYNDDLGTSRGHQPPGAYYLAQAQPGLADQIPNAGKDKAQIWGTSPSHGYKITVNAGFDVTSNSELYAFGNFARTHTDESFNYRRPVAFPLSAGGAPIDNGTAITNTGISRNGAYAPVYLTPCPAGSATCPAGGFVVDSNTWSAATLYPGGFTPRFVGVTKEAFGTAGWKGHLDDGFTWDLSGSVSRHELALSMYDSLNSSYGPQTQTKFDFGSFIQKEQDVNLDLTYPLEVGFASPITISGGGEYRNETFSATPGDEQGYAAGPYAAQTLYTQTSPGVYTRSGTAAQGAGASGYAGGNPAFTGSWSQKSYAFYVGAETDITQKLTVGAMGRYEHYSDFGSAKVWKANGLWKATPWLSLRGTVGTGFHAPTPGQSHDAVVTTSFLAGNAIQQGTYPVGSAPSLYFGSKPLKPEKSTNWGVGAVLKPLSRVTLTVDYYNIKVRNRIFLSQSFPVTAADIAIQPALAAVGAGGTVQYFTNALDTLTRGIDVVGSYHTQVLGGALNLTLAYNYNKSTVSKYDAAAISNAQIIDINSLAPKHRIITSAAWSIGDFAINARENFYSSWRDEVDYPGQKFGSKFTTDLDLSYTAMQHYTLTVGANNLFSNHPDKIKASSSNPIYTATNSLLDGSVYPRIGGPFGFNGGFYYVRLRVKY